MARDTIADPQSQPILGALHDVSNSVSSLAGAAGTLVEAADRMDERTRDELGALVLRQVAHLSWLVEAMREICDPRPAPGAERPIETGSLLRTAAALSGTPARIDGTAVFSGDFERVRLGLEALLDAVGHGDAVASLDESGRIVTVQSASVDLSFGGVRWRLALARRLLAEEAITVTIARDDGVMRTVVEFPNVIRL